MKRLIANLLIFISFLVFTFKNVSAQDKVDIAFWSQAWYQHVENGKGDNGLNDFMIRRAYLSVKGQPPVILDFLPTLQLTVLVRMG